MFFKDKSNLYDMSKIMSGTCVYRYMFVVNWMVFFLGIFIHLFLKVHKSVLRKITGSVVFLRGLWHQSMRQVSYHSKTLLHRHEAQARLWFVRLLMKNNKRNKHFNNCSYSLFPLMNSFSKQSLGGILQKRCS